MVEQVVSQLGSDFLQLNLRFTEWYRGRITFASANRMTWDVEYDDGDEGNNLCQMCIRPFVPYAVNETLEARVDDAEFASARVVALHAADDTVDIRLEDSDELWTHVEPKDLRRLTIEHVEAPGFVESARVMARFPGAGDEWYAGTIAKVNKDGSFAIQYDDGDNAPKIHRRNLRLLAGSPSM